MKKLHFLFKNTETPPWPQWPSCKQAKTLSFRGDDILKTLNSSVLNSPELCLITNSSEYGSFLSATTATLEEDDSGGGTGAESIETVIRGLRSTERLFFEPGETSSILDEASKSVSAAPTTSPTFKERSVVCSMESVDPYLDFKKSMKEMVEAHELLKDWDCLEELLCWYLKVNGKNNHGYIVEAFVDLLLGLSFTTTTTCSCPGSPSSPSSYTCSSTATTSTTTGSSSLQS